jgi:hypothetical protein
VHPVQYLGGGILTEEVYPLSKTKSQSIGERQSNKLHHPLDKFHHTVRLGRKVTDLEMGLVEGSKKAEQQVAEWKMEQVVVLVRVPACHWHTHRNQRCNAHPHKLLD